MCEGRLLRSGPWPPTWLRRHVRDVHVVSTDSAVLTISYNCRKLAITLTGLASSCIPVHTSWRLLSI